MTICKWPGFNLYKCLWFFSVLEKNWGQKGQHMKHVIIPKTSPYLPVPRSCRPFCILSFDLPCPLCPTQHHSFKCCLHCQQYQISGSSKAVFTSLVDWLSSAHQLQGCRRLFRAAGVNHTKGASTTSQMNCAKGAFCHVLLLLFC